MKNTSHFLDLDTGAVLRLRDAAGTGVTIDSGCAWITQEGDSRDIVLSPGMYFRLDRPGLAIVQMLKAGEIRVDFAGSPRLGRAALIEGLKIRRHDAIRSRPVTVFPAGKHFSSITKGATP